MPMPHIDEETILKRFESLPDDLKDALIGVGTADALYKTGRDAGLNIEQIGLLAQEVGLIILGFVPSANFISDLKTTLEVGEEKSAEIANEVNNQLFLPIRESLKKIHGAAWAGGLIRPPAKFEKQAATPPIPPSQQAEIRLESKTMPKKEIFGAHAEPKAPKEPMIIRPMGVPASPQAEKSVTPPPPMRSAAPSLVQPGVKKQEPAGVRPPEIRPPVVRIEETKTAIPQQKPIAPPPPMLPTAEKKVESPRPPSIFPRQQTPSPPPKIYVPPPPQKQPGTDPYREPF